MIVRCAWTFVSFRFTSWLVALQSDPPVIQLDQKQKIVKEGELVQIGCVVDGVPTPSVQWSLDGIEIFATSKYKIYRDHTLGATVGDEGTYRCEASNLLGNTSQEIQVDIFVPVTIESPKKLITLEVGNPLTLSCNADGYPKPYIKWTFFSKDHKIAPRTLRTDISNLVVIRHVQLRDEGFYTCMARNNISVANITYEVEIRAPPTIKSIPGKMVIAVDGDLVARVPCIVTGRPKPTVTWMMGNNLNIVLGTEWYDIDRDGTLLIKNVDITAGGNYKCKAENPLGSVVEDYHVIVYSHPPVVDPIESVFVEEGTSIPVDCGLPRRIGDRINWYKDGRFTHSGDLILYNAKVKDSGIYSCRVSNFKRAHSSHKNVTVGFKPSFTSDEETDIKYVEGSVTALSCRADGNPSPVVQWWKNLSQIEDTAMDHILIMESSDIGQYTCKVSNDFGTIERTFNIIFRECYLDVDKGVIDYQPIILSEGLSWPKFKIVDGSILVPGELSVFLFCPESFLTIGGTSFGRQNIATCVDKTIFYINGSSVEFSQIRCDKNIVPITKTTGMVCSHNNTELLQVGFDIGFKFLKLYEVCVSRDYKVPLYSKHKLSMIAAGFTPKDKVNFTDSIDFPFQFSNVYNCRRQHNSTLSLSRLSSINRCCYAKRQSVNPKDVPPGPAQVATYNNLNVLPIWSTCSTENWNEVEDRVRSLAKSLDSPLEVSTGSGHLMRLPSRLAQNNEHSRGRINRGELVPRYIWKVITNINEGKEIAIVQINVPDLTLYQAYSLKVCKDVCDNIDWMRGANWQNVEKGFTFCCQIDEFETAFGHQGIFKIPEFKLKSHMLG